MTGDSSDTSVSNCECSELRERVGELEQQVETLTAALEQITIPGHDTETDASNMEDLEIGGLSVGQILANKASRSDAEIIAQDVYLELSDTDVSVAVDRDRMRPIHDMATDLQLGQEDRIPTQSARRAARLFQQFWDRAKGEPEPKVTVTDQYYVMDSGQAGDVLQSHDDEEIADSSVSKVVARVFEALQRHSKAFDCQCGTVSECQHGLVVFDDTSGTNRVRAEKDAFHEYQAEIEATASDDEGEQPSEDLDTAEVPAEAADERMDELLQASTDGGF